MLVALLLGAMGFVLWYVLDRRAKLHAAPPLAVQPAGPAGARPAGQAGVLPAEPVDLTKHDGETIDFSSGHPVIRNSPEDQAALEAAAKELAEATKDITFEAPKKKAVPPPAPPKP